MKVHRSVGSILLLAAVSVLAGCGRNEAPRGVVRGKVTYKGDPVINAAIAFENEGAGVNLTANLGPDGSYQMKDYKGAGLPVGTYKVSIIPGGMMASADEIPLAGKNLPKKPTPTKIPENFLKSSTSGLRIEVKEGDNPPFDFELSKG